MYTIPNTESLATRTHEQKRVGISGASGTGKTVSALTAPGVIVLDFDNNVNKAKAEAADKKPEDIQLIPFHDIEFCKKLGVMNKRDALMKWLETHGGKFETTQTLVLDSWTTVQDAFDKQTTLEPAITDKGAVDKFVFWARKVAYARNLMEIFKTIKCNVIIIFHETADRNDKGELNGKLRPVMQGSFTDQIMLHLTDYYRQLAIAKYKEPNNTRSEIIGTDYMWQTVSDDLCNCKCSLANVKRIIPATWSSVFPV